MENKRVSTNWTSTALKFMGDGEVSVSKLVDQACDGVFEKSNALRASLRPYANEGSQLHEFIKIGARLDVTMGDFCRPFGQLRYATGILPDLTLEPFQKAIEGLGVFIDDLADTVAQWNEQAQLIVDKKQAPQGMAAWAAAADKLEERLKVLREEVKTTFALEERVAEAYRNWDGCLAANISNQDPNWKQLGQLQIHIKRDGFADIDQWVGKLKNFRGQGIAPEVVKASRVLEVYCKVKHLQKVLNIW